MSFKVEAYNGSLKSVNGKKWSINGNLIKQDGKVDIQKD